MATYKLGYTAASKTAAVALSPDTLPGGATDLGTFDHVEADSDVLFHHVRDILYGRKASNPAQAGGYPENITNMHEVKIVQHGPLINAERFAAADLAIAGTGNATAVIKAYPGNTTIANSAFNFVSSDPAKATVDATGKVTGVAAGTVTITATLKNGTGTCKIKAVVT